MTTTLLTVRVSALQRYSDCPRSNSLRFMRKDAEAEGYEFAPTSNSIGSGMGTGLHAMMAELFKQKRSYGHMNVEEAFAAREEAFEAEVAKGIIWDETTPHIDIAKKQLKFMSKAFLPIAEMIEPQNIEDELEYIISPLGNQAVPIKLIGRRDVKDTRNEIHDHKTGKDFPPAHGQLGGYAMLSLYRGEEVSAVRINFAPRLPLSRIEQCVVRSVRLDLDECLAVAWSTARDIQAHFMRWLETKDPHAFPSNPYSSTCTEKYCSAYGTLWCRVGACV